MKKNDPIFNKEFIDNLENLDLSKTDISAIYIYLSLFEKQMTNQEKALWSIILEKKDPDYEEIDDNDSEEL